MLFIFFKPLIGRFKCGADGCLILLQCGLSAQSSLCCSFIPHTAGQCSWLIMPSSVLMINPKNPGTSQMNVFSSHILALYETAPVCLSSLMTTEFPLRSINRNLFWPLNIHTVLSDGGLKDIIMDVIMNGSQRLCDAPVCNYPFICSPPTSV